MTVSEPIRDDPETPFDLIPCPRCVKGTLTDNRRGKNVKRRCRGCKGDAGYVLRGEPTGSPYCLILDYTEGRT